MHNFGTMYRFEVRKLFCRRITVVVLIAVSLLMIAMNVAEYAAGTKVVNTAERVLSGRTVDDTLLDEMRDSITPKTVTAQDGTQMMIGIVRVEDAAYKPLMDYLTTIGGNTEKAYTMSEADLKNRFSGVIDDALKNQNLTQAEQDYWQAKRETSSMPLTYGRLQNGWGDSVCILYVASILSMIAIAATLCGSFSGEMQLHTDAIIFSTRNGKQRLAAAKMLAGITVGMLETLVVLVACVGTQFAISGFGGGDTSVQFFFGPTAMDRKISTVFWVYSGIMLTIGLLMSVFAMCLSQMTRSAVAVIAVMMGLWLVSMLNPPYSWRLISQLCSYLPVTFLGSWTVSDYRMIGLFGHLLSILEAAPILYLLLSAALAVLTKCSYRRYQVNR